MSTIFPTTVPTKTLSQSISGSSMSFILTDILGWDGNALTSADFGTKAYGVFRNSAGTLMEIFEWDPSTVASASITILARGLKFNGDLTTSVAVNKLTWIKGDTSVEIGTSVPQLIAQYANLLNDQTLSGLNTFTQFPQKSGSLTPTQAAELATKSYVDLTATGSALYDQQIFAGTAGETLVAGNLCYFKTSDQRWWKADSGTSATALSVQLGIAEGAATAGTAVNILLRGTEKNLSALTAGSSYYVGAAGAISATKGTFSRFVGIATSTTRLVFSPDTDPENLKQDGQVVYAADSVGTDAYAITLVPSIAAYVTGMRFLFKAGTANTGNATLAVNGLAAKNILKAYNQTLVDNDIKAGQIVEVAYDGTQFQMLSQTAATTVSGADYQLFTASGTWTKPSGVNANSIVIVEAWAGGGGGGGAGAGSNGPGSGGGGAYLRKEFLASSLPATVSVTVGLGGTAGDTTGTSGGVGGNSLFGSYLTVYGGGGGAGSAAGTNVASGGGGGSLSAGGTGSGATAGVGGGPLGSSITNNSGFGGAYGAGAASSGYDSAYGGGGGGAVNGGKSVYGGGGGGRLVAGTSVFGGNGGVSSAGVAPGGGGSCGGAAITNVAGYVGARGEVRVWTIN